MLLDIASSTLEVQQRYPPEGRPVERLVKIANHSAPSSLHLSIGKSMDDFPIDLIVPWPQFQLHRQVDQALALVEDTSRHH
jgi:hypothetical protein